MKKLKKNLQNEYLVVYMDLSAIDKYKKNSLTRFDFMKLFYESIIKSCSESNIITIDTKILKYFKTRNFKLDKINKIPLLPLTEEDYIKFTTFVMDLPQQIYENYKKQIILNLQMMALKDFINVQREFHIISIVLQDCCLQMKN